MPDIACWHIMNTQGYDMKQNASALHSGLPDDAVIVAYGDLAAFVITYARVHINRLIKDGKFPPPVRISANRIGWRRSDIVEFARSRETVPRPTPKPHTDATWRGCGRPG